MTCVQGPEWLPEIRSRLVRIWSHYRMGTANTAELLQVKLVILELYKHYLGKIVYIYQIKQNQT